MCPFIFLVYILALLMGLIFQIYGATFVQLLRVLNIGFSNFQTHFLKLFATLRNKCYPVLKVHKNETSALRQRTPKLKDTLLLEVYCPHFVLL